MVLFLMSGLAQIPMLNTYPRVRKRNIMAYRSPNLSARPPMISGTTAPPIIPVQRIPAKVPWWLGTELSASEMVMDHMTDAKNPVAGKAISATSVGPNSATEREINAQLVKNTSTCLLSNNFSSTRPRRQPTVIIPQKYEMTEAPCVAGSTW